MRLGGIYGVKSPRKKICVDVDIENDDWEENLRLLKAFYQYSVIKREIWRTRHGYHIYLDIEIDERNWYIVRTLFGDDPRRLLYDEEYFRIGYWINKCFTSTEQYLIK